MSAPAPEPEVGPAMNASDSSSSSDVVSTASDVSYPVPYGYFEVVWEETSQGPSATMYFVSTATSVISENNIQNIVYFPPEFFANGRQETETDITEFCSILNNAIRYDNDMDDAAEDDEDDEDDEEDSEDSEESSGEFTEEEESSDDDYDDADE